MTTVCDALRELREILTRQIDDLTEQMKGATAEERDVLDRRCDVLRVKRYGVERRLANGGERTVPGSGLAEDYYGSFLISNNK